MGQSAAGRVTDKAPIKVHRPLRTRASSAIRSSTSSDWSGRRYFGGLEPEGGFEVIWPCIPCAMPIIPPLPIILVQP